ncbi:hypothetical protein LSUE1_G002993 [Lachnellula suecica]|uniref:Rhodopsin domain-containing protein n=1 Tax=Lachnellula suecica TaxID=602035 RepID=A0A8T9CD43_9HELO|nr:hypothetical protein LSUE1_G002993 [Lachnellula suecica]
MSTPEALNSSFNGQGALIFTAVFLALQFLFVYLRYVTKWFINLQWGADDVLIGLTLLLQIGLAAIAFGISTTFGVGYHQAYLEDVYPHKIERWNIELFVLSLIYNFSAILPKLAILIFYERVFGRSSARYSIRILAIILTLYAVLLTALDLGTCSKFAGNWDPTIPGVKCLNRRAEAAWITLPNILTDIWMLLLPLPAIWKLQTTRALKIGLTVTFLIGGIGLVSSIARFAVNLSTKSNDGTWEASQLLIFIQLEPGCYLISACLPTLRPLLDRFANWCVGKLPEGTFKTKLSGSRTAATQRFDMHGTYQQQPPAAPAFVGEGGKGDRRGSTMTGVKGSVSLQDDGSHQDSKGSVRTGTREKKAYGDALYYEMEDLESGSSPTPLHNDTTPLSENT